mgnify:CR=1 FL=1
MAAASGKHAFLCECRSVDAGIVRRKRALELLCRGKNRTGGDERKKEVSEGFLNHEFIRYVLPKGKTLNLYTQEDITVLMNNINSIRQESLCNKSPYEVTADKSILRLMELMRLHLIPADEIRLTSDLLKR